MGTDNFNDIAIVGISCKFPKSENANEYWNNIRNGVDCIETLKEEELLKQGISEELLRDKDYIMRCPSITDIDKFDADFFRMSPREANYMDPQQRLFLEKSWEVFEDAGYNVEQLDCKVGVFASVSASSYFLNNLVKNKNFIHDAGGMKAILHGLDKDHISTKVAYTLNLTGPAITVQTACSSSMIGVIMACQSLLTYQCDMALAGGVTINIPQRTGYLYEKGSILSSDGYCRPFDEEASGTVFGSGVGCVLLKRLDDALSSNDNIYAVIKGFAVGNDGKDKVGYTAPGIAGQMDVIGNALEFAEIDPSTIAYVEAHGTGTIMGDPIEVEALTNVYSRYTDKKQYCALGSVKANVGHLNIASGIAGVIKGALIIKNREIPPSININKENTKIPFKNTPFYINKESKKYKDDSVMRVGVSSFGIGGTNGHIILEEYIEKENSYQERDYNLLVLSGRDYEDLKNVGNNLLNFIIDNKNINLLNVERTLQVGRKPFKYRKAFLVSGVEDFISQLKEFGKEENKIEESKITNINLIISDNIKFNSNMIKYLYTNYSLVRKIYDEIADSILGVSNINLKELIYLEELNETYESIFEFCTSYTLVRTLQELGIEFKSVEGFGLGKLVVNYLQKKTDIEGVVNSQAYLERDVESDRLAGVGVKEDEIYIFLTSRNEAEEKLGVCMNMNNMYSFDANLPHTSFLELIGYLWEKGNNIDWTKLINISIQKNTSLPTYPFKRNSYWIYEVEKDEESKNMKTNNANVKIKSVKHKRPNLESEYVLPNNELEEALEQMWSELLSIEPVGVNDDFFELGGHSLMATQLISIVKDEFLVDIEISEIFDYPTISSLATLINNKLTDLINNMTDGEVAAYLQGED